jgi:hypothetical protein
LPWPGPATSRAPKIERLLVTKMECETGSPLDATAETLTPSIGCHRTACLKARFGNPIRMQKPAASLLLLAMCGSVPPFLRSTHAPSPPASNRRVVAIWPIRSNARNLTRADLSKSSYHR